MQLLTLYSIYKILSGEKYYFVLYDKCRDVVFKPSLFYGTWDMGAAEGIHFVATDKKFELVYAGSDSLDGPGSGFFDISPQRTFSCQ